MAMVGRRAVLGTTAAVAGVAALGLGGAELLRKFQPRTGAGAGGEKPNILVIVVDQMRAPQWFLTAPQLGTLLPNLVDSNGAACPSRRTTARPICARRHAG